MGRIYSISCRHCGYSNRAELGGGRMGFSIEHHLSLFSEEDKKTLMKMLEEKIIAEFSIENRLVKCEGCQPGELKTKTVIELTDKEGRHLTFGDCCDECGARLKVYNSDVYTDNKSVKCPVCNKDELEFKAVGFWD